MTTDKRISYVEILIQQQKFAEAENILTTLLAEDAGNVYFLSLLSEVLLLQGRNEQAGHLIDQAIGLAPDTPHLFYIKARIAIQQDRLNSAEQHLHHAIQLYPYDADYFALLANVKVARKQFEEALELTGQALTIDAENLLALNTRSTALTKLNRKEEAFETIEGALREDPNNAYTHTSYGWSLLEKGNHKKALEHFREALSNDPGFDYAQTGMQEALKAANPIYRLFLRYFFWMSNLTARYQWGVLIGIFAVSQMLKTVATRNEALLPFLLPFIIVLAVFASSTWIITPLSNLFLRCNKYGKLLLSRKDIISSNLVAISLAVSLTGLVLYFISSDFKMLTIAIFGFVMIIPLGTMLSPTKNKYSLLIYTSILAFIGLIAIGQTFSTGELFSLMTVIFLLGFFGFQWVANFIMIRENNP